MLIMKENRQQQLHRGHFCLLSRFLFRHFYWPYEDPAEIKHLTPLQLHLLISHTAYIQTAHLNSYFKKPFCLLKVQCAHTLICCFICSLEFAHFINPSLQKPTCANGRCMHAYGNDSMSISVHS